MIHLDTSVLIAALSGEKRMAPAMRQMIEKGERIVFSSLVLFEWLRGPRHQEQIEAQEELFPSSETIPFGPTEAFLAAELYRKLKRAHGREVDIAIAACAIVHNAHLWTLNPDDFKDIPNLKLWT